MTCVAAAELDALIGAWGHEDTPEDGCERCEHVAVLLDELVRLAAVQDTCAGEPDWMRVLGDVVEEQHGPRGGRFRLVSVYQDPEQVRAVWTVGSRFVVADLRAVDDWWRYGVAIQGGAGEGGRQGASSQREHRERAASELMKLTCGHLGAALVAESGWGA